MQVREYKSPISPPLCRASPSCTLPPGLTAISSLTSIIQFFSPARRLRLGVPCAQRPSDAPPFVFSARPRSVGLAVRASPPLVQTLVRPALAAGKQQGSVRSLPSKAPSASSRPESQVAPWRASTAQTNFDEQLIQGWHLNADTGVSPRLPACCSFSIFQKPALPADAPCSAPSFSTTPSSHICAPWSVPRRSFRPRIGVWLLCRLLRKRLPRRSSQQRLSSTRTWP